LWILRPQSSCGGEDSWRIYGSSHKKRRYWPKYIDSNAISDHFVGGKAGAFDNLPGNHYGTNTAIVAMEVSNFVISLMATYGTNEHVEATNAVNTTIKNNVETGMHYFKYIQIFHNRFTYRNAIDLHILLSHQPISVKATWATMQWEIKYLYFCCPLLKLMSKFQSNRLVAKKSQLLPPCWLIFELLMHNTKLE
jgi:hypothetical protein